MFRPASGRGLIQLRVDLGSWAYRWHLKARAWLSHQAGAGGERWGARVELWGILHSKVEKGRKGLRNNRREGRAWSPGRDMLGVGGWRGGGQGREGAW